MQVDYHILSEFVPGKVTEEPRSRDTDEGYSQLGLSQWEGKMSRLLVLEPGQSCALWRQGHP